MKKSTLGRFRRKKCTTNNSCKPNSKKKFSPSNRKSVGGKKKAKSEITKRQKYEAPKTSVSEKKIIRSKKSEKISDATKTAPTTEAEVILHQTWGPRPEYTKAEIAISQILIDEKDVLKFHERVTLVQSFSRGLRTRKLLSKEIEWQPYRKNVAMEILDTEKVYVENLTILTQEYLIPLKNILAEKEEKLVWFTSLASTVEILKNYNTELLNELTPIVESWHTWTLLGQVFTNAAVFLQLYSQYATKHAAGARELSDYSKRDDDVREFLLKGSTSPSTKRQTIAGFLIQPIQRIPRYRMLLQDLLKHTTELNEDYAELKKAYDQITALAATVEAKTEESEQTNKVIRIQQKMIGIKGNLVSPTRRFLAQGEMSLWTAEHPKYRNRVIILFNDLLIETKATKRENEDHESKLIFKSQFHLAQNEFAPIHEAGKHGFSFTYNTTLMAKVLFPDQDSCDEWLELLTTAKKTLDEKRDKHDNLVLDRAKQRAAKAKTAFTSKYATNGDSPEPSQSMGAPNSSMRRWEERKAAMRERAEARKAQRKATAKTQETQTASTGILRRRRKKRISLSVNFGKADSFHFNGSSSESKKKGSKEDVPDQAGEKSSSKKHKKKKKEEHRAEEDMQHLSAEPIRRNRRLPSRPTSVEFSWKALAKAFSKHDTN